LSSRAFFGAPIDPSTPLEDRDMAQLGTGLWNRMLIDATRSWKNKCHPEWATSAFHRRCGRRPRTKRAWRRGGRNTGCPTCDVAGAVRATRVMAAPGYAGGRIARNTAFPLWLPKIADDDEVAGFERAAPHIFRTAVADGCHGQYRQIIDSPPSAPPGRPPDLRAVVPQPIRFRLGLDFHYLHCRNRQHRRSD
jgi:hypothetical protein